MKEIVDIFKKIAKIPHCSFHAEKLRDFLIEEAKKSGCDVKTDKFGNIVAKKGFPKISLQAHYDMVCIGRAPDIEVVEENGFLKAVDSSLGADNGIGIAMILYFLKKYENIEALFTSDEEVGMIGAENLELFLESKNLLNLDSEEEGEIFIGCAGGVDLYATKSLEFEEFKENRKFYKISTKNLPGGHSGVDIDKNIPSAIKELAFYLNGINDLKIVKIEGGEALNSIPVNAYAVICADTLPKAGEFIEVEELDEKFDSYIKDSKNIVNLICSFAQGIRSWDREFDIPKTSINLGKIYMKERTLHLELFARSMENGELDRIKKETICFLDSFGFTTKSDHQFPAWMPKVSDFSKKVLEISKRYFNKAGFKAIHAGLECGILKDKFKDISVVSIGPNIYFPHSVKEKCEIESVFRVAKVVDELIKEMQ